MDPSQAGKLGGRPSKATKARHATEREVASGRQHTLVFTSTGVTHIRIGHVSITGVHMGGTSDSAASASAAEKTNIGDTGARGLKRKHAEDDTGTDDEEEDVEEDETPASDDDVEESDDEDRDDEDSAASDDLAAEIPLRKKRRTFTEKEKGAVLRLLARVKGNKAKAARIISKTPGYETVTARALRRWAKVQGKAKKRSGRPVNTEFEKAVLSFLIYTVLVKVPEEQAVDPAVHARVVANVAHDYAIIKNAAALAKELPAFASDPKLKKLKLSDRWVVGFLRRCTLRRRRVTATEKDLPPVADVRARMTEIQGVIKDGLFATEDIISADETGILFGAPPKVQYVPENARATAPEANDKARFTALMWGAADGRMGVPFIIIKCSVKKADMRSVRVLDTLLMDLGGAAAGWQKKTWSRELELKIKKSLVKTMYFRPYLVHTSGTVITVQHKAWMDSVGMAMWADTQMGPWARDSGRRKMIVWDNCGPHNVDAVKSVFAEWDITTAALPPKMTDILQVMDLVVNGPLKAAIRRKRCEKLFAHFINFKAKCAQELLKETRTMPVFAPPKPTLVDGLHCLIETTKTDFAQPSFQDGLRRAFVLVGLAPNKDGIYANYASHSRSHLKAVLAPADSPSDDMFVLGDVAAEVEMEARPEVEEEEADEADEDDDP
jgi:hypothetical protein